MCLRTLNSLPGASVASGSQIALALAVTLRGVAETGEGWTVSALDEEEEEAEGPSIIIVVIVVFVVCVTVTESQTGGLNRSTHCG